MLVFPTSITFLRCALNTTKGAVDRGDDRFGVAVTGGRGRLVRERPT